MPALCLIISFLSFIQRPIMKKAKNRKSTQRCVRYFYCINISVPTYSLKTSFKSKTMPKMKTIKKSPFYLTSQSFSIPITMRSSVSFQLLKLSSSFICGSNSIALFRHFIQRTMKWTRSNKAFRFPLVRSQYRSGRSRERLISHWLGF